MPAEPLLHEEWMGQNGARRGENDEENKLGGDTARVNDVVAPLEVRESGLGDSHVIYDVGLEGLGNLPGGPGRK
jgi:hypothetical protein